MSKIKIKNPEITKVFNCNTNHCKRKDFQLIASGDTFVSNTDIEGGFLVEVNIDKDYKSEGFSKDFIAIIGIAHDLSCSWVLFGFDGIIYPELKEYPWTGEIEG